MREATPTDLPTIRALLAAADLPVEGLAAALADTVVEPDAHGAVVGAAAIERHDGAALLRSVVVAPGVRGTGLGRRLVADRLRHAAATGLTDAYLLTTTAEAFFTGLGFRTVPRTEAPAGIAASPEFAALCPDTAAFMHRALG
ncbi:MAG: arsenic resistance N-acetyltransferase ArsN2 [Thermoleophilia bacterium]